MGLAWLCSWSPQHPAYCMNLANLGLNKAHVSAVRSYAHLIAWKKCLCMHMTRSSIPVPIPILVPVPVPLPTPCSFSCTLPAFQVALSGQQLGFRPQSSTQEALYAATNDWHKHCDSNFWVSCVVFDLSKAFDILSHSLILSSEGLKMVIFPIECKKWWQQQHTWQCMTNCVTLCWTRWSGGSDFPYSWNCRQGSSISNCNFHYMQNSTM